MQKCRKNSKDQSTWPDWKTALTNEIVARFERELELNALEKSDDLPMATMTSPHLSLKIFSAMDYYPISFAIIARKKIIWSKSARTLKREMQQTEKKTYPKCGTCGKTNHPEERFWQGSGAHLKSKRKRPEDSSDNNPYSKAQKSEYNIVQLPVLIKKGR